MRKYIFLSEKPWHLNIFRSLSKIFREYEWILISEKEEFTAAGLKELAPDMIFIPHWSFIIPSEIYNKYECVVFHMTDLPFGRGGSPLQNLIDQGYQETKISALKVQKGLDTGPVYLKKPLSLFGSAEEIFIRSSGVVETMIAEILENDLKPIPQKGKVVEFKRRTPEQGNISNIRSIGKIYDYIRMLDCEGYPPAFIETENFRFEFSRASLRSKKQIIADVRIVQK